MSDNLRSGQRLLVITSYSIHYTKLYEVVGAGLVRDRVGPHAAAQQFRQHVAQQPVRLGLQLRPLPHEVQKHDEHDLSRARHRRGRDPRGQETMVVEAIKLGALDFIVKPFKPDRILQTVSKVLG